MSPRKDNGTPWRHGRFGRRGGSALLFGRMCEDPSIELAVFPPAGRVFSIASAGCTSFALAGAGHSVTAVDINPAQIEYARARLLGAPAEQGAADRMMSRGRRLAWLFGWTESNLRAFLSLDDTREQADYWRRRLDTVRWRCAIDSLLHPTLLRAVYAGPFVRSLPERFGRIVRARLERGWATHPNRHNPYAWRLLLGSDAPGPAAPLPPSGPIEFVCADAAEYLESRPPACFDGFSLSNILDAAGPAYRRRLMDAVRRAASPEAVMTLRSFSEPHSSAVNWAARDRSMLWGIIDVKRVHSE